MPRSSSLSTPDSDGELEEVKPQDGHRVALLYFALVCTLLTDTPSLADRNRQAHRLDMS